jgi:hypothetical protein
VIAEAGKETKLRKNKTSKEKRNERARRRRQ